MILCISTFKVGVEPFDMWNNVGTKLGRWKLLIPMNIVWDIFFSDGGLLSRSWCLFPRGGVPSWNWTGSWFYHMGRQWTYLGKITRPGDFSGIIIGCIPLIIKGNIHGIIWSPPQVKRFSALGRSLSLTFTWILSINNLVLLHHVMREWQVWFVGIWFCVKIGRGFKSKII